MHQVLCAQATRAYRHIIRIGHRRNINVTDNVGRLNGNMMASMGAEAYQR